MLIKFRNLLSSYQHSNDSDWSYIVVGTGSNTIVYGCYQYGRFRKVSVFRYEAEESEIFQNYNVVKIQYDRLPTLVECQKALDGAVIVWKSFIT